MKKWLLLIACILIAACAGIYLYIPANLHIVQVTPVKCTTPGAYRHLAGPRAWQQWWPGHGALTYKGDSFRLTKTLLNTVEVHIRHQDVSVSSTVHLLPLPSDSTAIEWQCSLPSGGNPFTRLQRYRQALAIKNNMAGILARFKAFAENKDSIYGIPIRVATFQDSALITTKTVVPAYPSSATICASIHTLQAYIKKQGAAQAGHPIASVTPLEGGNFQLMAAVPVNTPVAAGGPFYKTSIPRVKFLVAQVTGGDSTIKRAFEQMQFHIQDYHQVIMAVPFQQLVTDRTTEPDTSKWVTTIYFPIF